ncbi:MAG: CYTH domain-containing protein [Alcanivoracaceae bacterium]|jgi:CYTH domain-containing protein|nr:CYTH domain-containing protein [Alcanivoracaceae bacterium]
MATEIERKFLLRETAFLENLEGQRICQGYLSHSPEATVRIRLVGDQAFLTIKGRSTGIRRAEFEYPIPADDALAMLALCGQGRIDKTRYRIKVGNHIWEVDVFAGDNQGLIVAEIELASERETFVSPDWLGEEVSHDPRYFNSQLSQKPYNSW